MANIYFINFHFANEETKVWAYKLFFFQDLIDDKQWAHNSFSVPVPRSSGSSYHFTSMPLIYASFWHDVYCTGILAAKTLWCYLTLQIIWKAFMCFQYKSNYKVFTCFLVIISFNRILSQYKLLEKFSSLF